MVQNHCSAFISAPASIMPTAVAAPPSFAPVEAKMKDAGLSDAAIAAFRLNFDALASGATGLVRGDKRGGAFFFFHIGTPPQGGLRYWAGRATPETWILPASMCFRGVGPGLGRASAHPETSDTGSVFFCFFSFFFPHAHTLSGPRVRHHARR
jgi:hypothetical protein